MDSLTQTALGVAVAQAGFRGKLGPGATAVGVVAGFLPDADVVVRLFGDEWSMLRHHRGLTHSLAAVPAFSALVGWLAWRWARREGRLLAWIALAAGVLLTHVILDWCTSYGTMLFYPLSLRRFAADAVAIVDPLYSLPLFAGTGASLWLRRRSPPGARAPGRVAAGTLAFTTAYLVLGACLSVRGARLARHDLARSGFEVARVRATPHIFAWPLRRVVAQDSRGDLMVAGVTPFGSRAVAWTKLPWPDDPMVEKALASDEGRVFRWFADGMLSCRVEREGARGRVDLVDQRYGLLSAPERAPFEARFHFDEDGALLRAERAHDTGSLDFAAEVSAAWGLLLGRAPMRGPARALRAGGGLEPPAFAFRRWGRVFPP